MAVFKHFLFTGASKDISNIVSTKLLVCAGYTGEKFLGLYRHIFHLSIYGQAIVTHAAILFLIGLAKIHHERFASAFISLQELHQVLEVFLRHLFFFALLLVDKVLNFLLVGAAAQQQTVGAESVTAGAPNLLIV